MSENLGRADLGDAAATLEDAKAFNKGKGRLLAGMLGLLVAAIGAFAFYLVQDQPNPYGELGKQVNGLRGSAFDGFFSCALPGSKPAELKSNEDLLEELHGRGAAGARYGSHLRDKCRPTLADLSVRLRALLPPEDAEPLVKQMADAVSKIEAGVNVYADHLQGLEGPYDRDVATSQLEGLTRGWYEFRKAHAELNKLIKEKLNR